MKPLIKMKETLKEIMIDNKIPTNTKYIKTIYEYLQYTQNELEIYNQQ